MQELLQELFAAKVFFPALHFVSRPVSDIMSHDSHMIPSPQDFVNKVLTIVFNKGSVS